MVKIREFFDDKISQSKDNEEKFVCKTASGFVHIISTFNEFDESLKRIVNIYVQKMVSFQIIYLFFCL